MSTALRVFEDSMCAAGAYMHAFAFPLGLADYMRSARYLIVISDVPIFCMLAFLGCWAYNSGARTVWGMWLVRR